MRTGESGTNSRIFELVSIFKEIPFRISTLLVQSAWARAGRWLLLLPVLSALMALNGIFGVNSKRRNCRALTQGTKNGDDASTKYSGKELYLETGM